MIKIYKEIFDLVEGNYKLDDETKFVVEQLIEILEAKEKHDNVGDVLHWLDDKRKEYPVDVKEIGVNELNKWDVEPVTGNVVHESGKFFSVIGVRTEGAMDREVLSWDQPMIKQKECGILGILCKKFNGLKHYLLQAKFEPGNMNKLQLSPTLQATESNLKQYHKGKKPLFAEYFEEGGKGKIISNVVSVEDGGRFFLKTNRNMVVEVDENEEVHIPLNFIWVNLYQLKKLLKKDIVVNSLARSILGGI